MVMYEAALHKAEAGIESKSNFSKEGVTFSFHAENWDFQTDLLRSSSLY